MIRNTYLVFNLISGTELLKPWNILNEENLQGVFYYVNEVTLGIHLRMGAGCQENQSCD